MPLLNEIKEMQDGKMNDSEIIQKLQEQGYSPLEISQALEQSKIKTAVTQPYEENLMEQVPGMEPSLIQEQAEEQIPMPEQQQQETTEQTQAQEFYPAQPYYQQYPQYQPYSSDTITEISEQIAEEKINVLKKDISSITDFKIIAESKIKDIDERLKKIESMIDKLQASILGKIGNFGQGIEEIKQEMRMMQESFSKTLPDLVGKKHEIKESREENKEKKHKRKSNGFEHYLRR